MPTAGDTFITKLKKAHLEWGSHRHTSTRGRINGEAYLQIPLKEARRLEIYNSNKSGALTEYNCNSVDGFLENVLLKASGCSKGGDIHAKQFQGSGALRLLGAWFVAVGAKPGDRVRITWISSSDIEIAKI